MMTPPVWRRARVLAALAAAVAVAGESGEAPQAPPRCGSFGHAASCLAGKHVLIVGSSVSRHWWFALQEVLSRDGGRARDADLFAPRLARRTWAPQYREREKALCGGGAPAWSELSHGKTRRARRRSF